MNSVVQLDGVYKTFHVGIQDIEVLKNITFEIKKGDFTIVFGPSGSGKSTILHTILGLEKPTKGKVYFMGKDLYAEGIKEDDRSVFRKNNLGMVYQQSNWIKSLNVLENIAFPVLLMGEDKEDALSKAEKMIAKVGMEKWGKFAPTELSGGQQQKVAIARSIINDPDVVIADEPTGNLDYESGQEIMELFLDLNKSLGKTVIMVTHDLEYLQYAKSAISIFDGEVEGIFSGKDKTKFLKNLKEKRMRNLGESSSASA